MKKTDRNSTQNDSDVMRKLEEMDSKLEHMDNKLERIKSDTHSLNRVTCINYSPLIVKELKKAVGRSEVRAAILHLTKDEISAGDLVKALGIHEEHLSAYMKPFLGNRGYIVELKVGRNKYFQRSEQVDVSSFEADEDYQKLLKSWEAKRIKGTVEDSLHSKEDTIGS
jgi:hypothetical protein